MEANQVGNSIGTLLRLARALALPKRLRSTLCVVAIVAVQLGLGALIPAVAIGAPEPPACANIGSTGGGCASGPVVLTKQQQTILADKESLAREFKLVLAGKTSLAAFQQDARQTAAQYQWQLNMPSLSPDICTDPCPPASWQLYLVQQPQQTDYYCGPATASEILSEKGHSYSQSFLAGSNYLNTDNDGGTNWGPPSVMQNTLNSLLSTNYYVAVSGSGVGGGFSTSDYEADLTVDIYTGWPIAGNVVEPQYGLHLTGHPADQTIYHWIAIRGYSSSGGYTTYADSVYDAPTVPWYQDVTSPYSTISSDDMASMLNGRGFIW